jgi:hypothetical protein
MLSDPLFQGKRFALTLKQGIGLSWIQVRLDKAQRLKPFSHLSCQKIRKPRGDTIVSPQLLFFEISKLLSECWNEVSELFQRGLWFQMHHSTSPRVMNVIAWVMLDPRLQSSASTPSPMPGSIELGQLDGRAEHWVCMYSPVQAGH